jgi:TolB protein
LSNKMNMNALIVFLFVKKAPLYGVLLACFYSVTASALQIEITQGNSAALPIAIVPFADKTQAQAPAFQVGKIIAADLQRSGLFTPLPIAKMPGTPSRIDQVKYTAWRATQVEHMLIGEVSANSPSGYLLEYRLLDVVRGREILAHRLPTSAKDLRAAAHRIADQVYQALTGKPGAFSTKIAYVTSTHQADGKRLIKIKVADADGYNAQTIVTSQEPLMSPAWSPDGQRLAYVSFERGRSAVWIQNIKTGQRQKVAAYRGINGAPAWSPDGQKLAMTLSKDGNPDIYILDIAQRSVRALTRHVGIDTEPTWSPDGKQIVFTSNRGGSAQLYRIPVTGGKAKRLTFEGSYNARASYAPEGRYLTFVTRVAGRYRIGLLDTQTSELRVLSRGSSDESPGFAPNGSMIMYASQARGRDVLATVSTDGSFQQRISLEKGNMREPAWSPR